MSGPEDTYAEQPALDWLQKAGWSYAHGHDFTPSPEPGAERRQWSDVVLKWRLRAAVARINPQLPPDAVQHACERATSSASPVPIEDHRELHELLVSHVPVSYTNSDGVERHDNARLIDFDDLANNELLAVNQFTIADSKTSRRPDILLFVNGLPLGQIEVKAPGEIDSAQKAINQVHHYTDTIPKLYRYVEIVGVSDLIKRTRGHPGHPRRALRRMEDHRPRDATREAGGSAAGDDRGSLRPDALPGADPRLRAVRERWRKDLEGNGQVPPGSTQCMPRSSRSRQR